MTLNDALLHTRSAVAELGGAGHGYARFMIGLPRGTVQVVPYQSCWPELFHLEANRIRLALGSAIDAVEHVGSTAVPGLSAKPIIDMLAAVPNLAVAHTLIARLEQLGYEHRPDVPAPSRLFFVLGPQTCRTHHLSLAEVGSPVWQDQTAVRDYLRAQPEVSAEYAALKHQLAVQFAADRTAYTAAKEPFIHTLMAKPSPPAAAPAGLRDVGRFRTPIPMKKIFPAVLLAATDLLIIARYPLDPAAGDLSSALLGGTGIFVLLGLLGVLCSEQLSAFTGPVMRGGYVSQETPAGMFVCFGYLLLLLPVILVCYRVVTVTSSLPPIAPGPQ